jgi:hypothetical protein
VALHIPDGLIALPGTHEAAIQQLLQVRVTSGVALCVTNSFFRLWCDSCHLGPLRGTAYSRWASCAARDTLGSNPVAAADALCLVLCVLLHAQCQNYSFGLGVHFLPAFTLC